MSDSETAAAPAPETAADAEEVNPATLQVDLAAESEDPFDSRAQADVEAGSVASGDAATDTKDESDETRAQRTLSIDEVKRAAHRSSKARDSRIAGVMIVLTAVAIDMLGLSIILPVLPFYALKFNASSFEVGLVFGAYALAQTLSTPISGKLSDKFGRRPMILISLLGSCLGFLFQGFSNSFGVFLVARFSAGAVGASVPIAMAYIADVTTPAERPRFLAFLGSVIGAAFLFGPGIGSGLAQFSLQTPMFVSSALAGLGFVVAFFKLHESLNKKPTVPQPAAPDAESVSKSSAPEFTEADKKAATGYTIALCAAEFLNMSAFTSILTMLGLYTAEKFGFEALELGFVFSYQSVVFVLVQLTVFPKLVARMGKHATAVLGCALFSIGVLIIPLSGDIMPLLFVSMSFSGAGFGLVQPALPSLMSRYNDKSNQGRAMGLGQSMQALSRVITPAIFGVLYELAPVIPFYVSTGCGVLTGILLFSILQHNKAQKARRADGMIAKTPQVELAMTPAILNEANRIEPERVRLLGRMTSELLVKAGYTADQLNSDDGLGIALHFLELAMDTTQAEGEVGEALRSTTNVRSG